MEITKNHDNLKLDHLDLENLYFVTNRKNLLTILSVGLITTTENVYRYEPDSREETSGNIHLLKNAVLESSINDESVIIELEAGIQSFLSQFEVLSETADSIVTSLPIPLYFAKKYLFTNNNMKDDFVLRLFDDIPIDLSLLGVSDGLVKKSTPFDIPEIGQKPSLKSILLSDKKLGAMLAVYNLVHPTLDAIKEMQYLFNLSISEKEISIAEFSSNATSKRAGKGKIKIEVDDWMMRTTLSLLAKSGPEKGFDALEFIEEINRKSEFESNELSLEVKNWCNYVFKIVDGEIDVHQLSDKGSIVQRGLLLFLLRPRMERLEKSESSVLRPGPKVLTLGAYLAGYYTGAQRMGKEYKNNYAWYMECVKVSLESLLLSIYTSGPCNELKVAYTKVAISHMVANLTITDFEVIKLNLEPDPVLARVLYQGRSLDYHLDYNFEHDELSYTFQFEGGRKQQIFIIRIKSNLMGDDVVRFLSPCRSLTGSGKSRLLKNDLISLLERNDEYDMHCRFAISNERKAIVVQVDQIVKNMDDSEFKSHIEYVARVADNYENEITGEDRY